MYIVCQCKILGIIISDGNKKSTKLIEGDVIHGCDVKDDVMMASYHHIFGMYYDSYHMFDTVCDKNDFELM